MQGQHKQARKLSTTESVDNEMINDWPIHWLTDKKEILWLGFVHDNFLSGSPPWSQSEKRQRGNGKRVLSALVR